MLTQFQFSDVGKLLAMYQLWLDELYPRAKFGDGLTIIEKLGHSKRIQIMRREWINEGKPESRADDEPEMADQQAAQTGATSDEAAGTSTSNDAAPNNIEAADREPAATRVDNATGPDADELDALMAENASYAPLAATNPSNLPPDINTFDDDEEAMAGMW